MWDLIVSQIPRTPPTLLPMLVFDYMIHPPDLLISKAVEEEEARMIFGTSEYESEEIFWKLRSGTENCHEIYHCFYRARMLGWNYASEEDRRSHVAELPFCMRKQ
jgi:hypothetical protein